MAKHRKNGLLSISGLRKQLLKFQVIKTQKEIEMLQIKIDKEKGLLPIKRT